MSNEFDIDSYFSLMKDVTGITVDQEWEKVVKFHIANAKKMADICDDAPIDPNSLELSNVFRPGEA